MNFDIDLLIGLLAGLAIGIALTNSLWLYVTRHERRAARAARKGTT